MYTQAHKRAVLKYYKTAKGKECLRKYRQGPKFREYMRKYRARNKAKVASWLNKSWMKREALKRGIAVGDSAAIAKVYERAQWWRQWFDVAVDHIIPLSRNGTHEAKNLQIIYQFENARKHNQLDYKPRVIFV